MKIQQQIQNLNQNNIDYYNNISTNSYPHRLCLSGIFVLFGDK